MKTQFRKTTAWLLTFAMLFTMLPGFTLTASAANGEEAPTCICGSEDAVHATNCPAYVAPENPECFCAEKCTEENINVWCDVCGVQGVAACEGEDTAATYAFNSLTVGGVDALTTSSGSGWSYNASSSTLTITGNIGAVNATVPANAQDVLNITVTNNATVDGGIYAGGKLNLVVNSGVTLIVNSNGDNHAIASGYSGVQDSVKITGGGTVAAISSGNGDGIKSAGGLWIEGVTVAAQGRNYGLDSGSGRLYIKDNSKVYAVSFQNTAIVALSSAGHDVVEISGENTVVVAGFALGSAANNYVPTIDTPSNSSIHAGTVKVNCGHLIIGDGFSVSSFDTGRMVLVSHSNYAEYVGHLTNYQQNSDGTHTPKCIDGCPVPTTGTVEDCSGTTYCNKTVCDKCGQTSGTGDGTSHKEGTAATCTAQAVCEVCKQPYGEFDPTNHTGSATGNYTYVDGTYHSAIFDCCNVVGGAKQEHESANGDITCDICNGLMLDKVLVEIANASSGTTLNYSGTLGTEANPDSTSQVIMTIPEGVTVNWGVDAVVNMSDEGNIDKYPLSLSGGGTLNLTGSIKNKGNSASVILTSGSTVTLVVANGGEVQCTGGVAIVAHGGKEIRVEGGTVSGAGSSYTILVGSTSTADMMVTGGKVEATGAGYAIYVAESSKSDKMIISGGEVTGNNAGIYTYGNVVVSGTPTISGTTGSTNAAIRAGNLEISGNPTISHTSGHGILILNSGNVIFRAGTTATVTGGNCGIYNGHVAMEVGANPTISSTAGDTYAYWNTTSCSGGAATCKSGPVCTTCGTTYGTADESAHTGGTATCASGPVCTVCGNEYGQPDDSKHVWGYTVSNGTITAACTNVGCDADGGSFTLQAPSSLIADGNAKQFTYTGSISGVTPKITYSQEPIPADAGTYTVTMSITVDGETYSVSQEYTILEGLYVTFTNTTSVTTKSADWTPNLAAFDTSTGIHFVTSGYNDKDSVVNGNYTVQWYDADNNPLSEAPTDVGTYTIKVTLSDTLSGTCVLQGDTLTYTINPLDLSTAIIGFLSWPNGQPRYNGQQQLPDDVGATVGNSSYILPEGSYTIEAIEGKNCTNAGTAYCLIKGTGGNVIGEKERTYSISMAQLDLPDVTERVYTYDGTSKATDFTNETLPDGYASVEPLYWYEAGSSTRLAEAPSDAGEYEVYVKYTPTDAVNYQTKYRKEPFEIKAATPVITWSNNSQSVNYTGEAATITAPVVTLVNNETYSGTISYSYTGTSGGKEVSGNGLPINAGTYEITASIAAQGNYTAATSINTLTLTINKAPAPAIVWPTASSLVYGQKLSASTLTSNDSNGTFAWKDGNIVPTVTNSGYVVVYTPKDTDNYDYSTVTLEQTIPVTVTAADQADFSISGVTTATYGDPAITLNAAGGSGTGTITWKITSGSEYAEISGNGTTATLTIKSAGTVVVEATKASDGNYNAKVDTHTIVIGKATVDASDFTYTAPSDLVYSKTAKVATVTGDSAYGAITIKYYSDSSLTTIVDPINVGTYYVGITTDGGDNYEALSKTLVGSFTITARPVTVTADAQSRKYGEDNPTLTYTHNLIDGDSFSGALTTTATKTSDVGEYDITIGDLANSNYSISFTGAKLTITKADGPAAPTVTGSYKDNGMTYTYTIDVIEGAEYSEDGTTWQDSNVFENLVAGQKYTFYARIKETKNYNPGAVGTSAEVDLSKLPGVGTVTIGDWTYGETAQAPVTGSTTGNAVESYLYESTDGKGYSNANAPTNAGEYKLTVTFAATATHNGTTASDTFTIKKATPVVDAPTGLTATYGDTLADVQLETGWAWKDAGTTEVGNAGENTFTVIYTHPTDAANHEQVEKTVTIAVNPKVVTAVVSVVGENFIFNGSKQKPGVTVKDGETNITIPESEYTVAYTNNTNAGNATVTITDKDGGNYTVSGTTTFAIAKKASSALSGVEREFLRTIATTGNEIDVEAMLPDNHGTVTYSVTSSGYTVLENVSVDQNGKLVFDTKTSAAAASDTITVKVEMQNYTDVTLTVSVILNDKAPQEITGVSAATGLIYNGKAQQGYTGTPTSDYTGAYEITYTGRDNTYNSSVAPTNAGDYTVTFKIPDSDLYYSGNVSVNFTIGKARTIVTADDKEVYIGNRMPELTYKVSGLIGDDTISVELSCDANMNRAGETPIVVSATDPNGNYEITTINGTLTVKYYPYIPIITPTYPPVVDGGDNGDVVVTPKNPEKGDTVTITPDPDAGYEVDEVIVTDKNGNPIPVIDNGDGTYSFKQPSGKVTITVTFAEIDATCPGDKTCPMYGYTDLDRTAWYHDGVHFCIENDLMNGTGTNTFAPGMTTSRAMIVTILWRLEGEPTVNVGTDFSDVENGKWYSEAIKWAAANNIVNGYGNGLFGPDDVITREQLATILYRYEQYKGGGFKGMWMFRMDYVDLADVSDWAYEAMCWMNMNGIVNGKPGKVLDPKGSATRAEAATMLYRYCEVMTKEEEN